MNRILLEDLHQHFEQIEKPMPAERHFLCDLTAGLSYFPISHLSRADLTNIGYESSHVDDCDMIKIAKRMHECFIGHPLYRESLEQICKGMEIPKSRKKKP